MQSDRRSEGDRQQTNYDSGGRDYRSRTRQPGVGEKHLRRPDTEPRPWDAPSAAGSGRRGTAGGYIVQRLAAYLRARAIKENFAARTAQLEYEERAGKLIQATKAGEYAAEFSAIVGDALSAMPDRLTPLIAATTSEDVIHKILTAEINTLRRKVAKAIADAGF